MQTLAPSMVDMYRAVRAVCDAKASVWHHSAAFADAFTDFCGCIDNILRLQSAGGDDRALAAGLAVELQVADTILTMEMDELIQLFEAADVAFVDDYTTARSMEIAPPMV